jgi:hypothetical protein
LELDALMTQIQDSESEKEFFKTAQETLIERLNLQAVPKIRRSKLCSKAQRNPLSSFKSSLSGVIAAL